MADLIPLRDAVKSINARTPIGSTLRSREWELVPVQLRQRAQFSAGVESARVLAAIQHRLSGQIALGREQLGNGKSAIFDRSSFIDSIRAIAREEGLAPQDPSKGGGLRDITSIPRLGLIYDMQNAQAAGYARWKLDNTEGALLLYPAWEFVRIEERKQPRQDWMDRWFKAANEAGDDAALSASSRSRRMVALKTSGLWTKLSRFGVPWPPFDWGSGMGLEDVERDTAVELGLIGETERLQPAEETFNAGVEASTAGMADYLKDFLADYLRKAFGSQIRIDGDSITWAGGRPEVDDSDLTDMGFHEF